MPEIITKHPDVVLKILQGSGAKCGINEAKILTSCPKEQLCTFKNGEICVYSIKSIASMKQISPAEIAEITSGVPNIFSSWNIALLAIACLFGMIFGMLLKRK